MAKTRQILLDGTFAYNSSFFSLGLLTFFHPWPKNRCHGLTAQVIGKTKP